MDEELSRFKQKINLCDFAASYGYMLDRRESSVASASMRNAKDDKIIVAKGESFDWIYFSINNDVDNGTIIDFLQNREKLSLGQVRKRLRDWTGDMQKIPFEKRLPDLQPTPHDRQKAFRSWEQARLVTVAVPYLESRGLGVSVTGHPRFAGRFRLDYRHNVLFPHFDRLGLCGYEIKNKGFTGFAPGGFKGLWASVCHLSDKALVITESAIDALSFFALHPDLKNARYMSTGGALNPSQPELLIAAATKMPPGSVIFLATDQDKAGDELADAIKALLPSSLEIRRARPLATAKDWNDVLRVKVISNLSVF